MTATPVLRAMAGRQECERPKANLIAGPELLAKVFPPVRWIIPDIIPEGLTLLAAKPKMGKTWLALGAAVAVCNGGATLTDDRLEVGDVLYMGLEDGERRIQERLIQLLAGSGSLDRLTVCDSCPALDEGGLADVQTWLTAHPSSARLVVVDTLKRIRPKSHPGQSAYESDYEALQGLADLAHQYSVAVLVLFHLRKMPSPDDPFDEISGTTGLQAAADTLIVLRRTRGKQDAAMHVTGRVSPKDLALAMEFDQFARWHVTGGLDEREQSQQSRDVLDLLSDFPDGLTPKEVARQLGRRADTIRQQLRRMHDRGALERQDGRYLPSDSGRDNCDSRDSRDIESLSRISRTETPEMSNCDTVTPSEWNPERDTTCHTVTVPDLTSAGAINSVTGGGVTAVTMSRPCRPCSTVQQGQLHADGWWTCRTCGGSQQDEAGGDAAVGNQLGFQFCQDGS